MTKRGSEQTVTKATHILFPERGQGSIRAVLVSQTDLTVRNLRDAKVNGEPVVENILSALKDADFIHKSVAAVYCRRSEIILDRAIAKTAMTKGDTQTRKAMKGSGNRAELDYRVGFVKKVEKTIEQTYAAGNVSRSEKAKSKVKSVVHAATDTKIPWLTDSDGTIYVPVTMPDGSGGIRMAKLIKSGARIELLTLAQAMTERTWHDPADRAPWHEEYVAILEEEVLRTIHQHGASAALHTERGLIGSPAMEHAPEPPPRKTL